MNTGKITFILLSIVLIFGCKSPRDLETYSNPLYERFPEIIIIDTIEGVFYYENKIDSYIEHEVIVKGPGFVKGDSISESTYKNGYFIDNWTYLESLQRKGLDISFNKKAISNFYDSLLQRSVREETWMGETEINPFCGGFYKKYRMKIEVFFIETISQRTPLFMDCSKYNSYIEKNKGKNFTIMALPTYIITDIFAWEEL